jgi:pimeloyl-ACP methyl ester carboxylesterase
VGALLLLGAVGQQLAERRDRRRHPAPGELVRLRDCTVHVLVQGSGPTVLFDSGLGGSSIEWRAIAAELSGDFTVVTYDRPGFAWSPGSSVDRRSLAAATRVVELIDALELPGPVILVGHSLGGIHVRLAAALAPERIAGLVLADPSHEDMLKAADAARQIAVMAAVLRLVAALSPLGAGRLVGRGLAKLTLSEARQPLSDDQRAAADLAGRLTVRTTHGLRALAAENAALPASLQQFRDAVQTEPDLPLTVITAAAPSTNPRMTAAREAIDALHQQLVEGRPHAAQVLAETSGHLVPLDAPELIVRCVRETAAAITRGTA